MNTEKNMSAEEQQIQDLWYSRKPSHDLDPEGKDRFWGTLLMLFKEYASQQNKELIAENLTYISLLDDATKEFNRQEKYIEELIQQLRTESDCVEHMKDVEVNYKKEIEELKDEIEKYKRLKETATIEWKKCILNNSNMKSILESVLPTLNPNYAMYQVVKEYLQSITPNNNEK